MAYSLYIAGIEPGSGKSLVALGVMELLSRRIRQIGYFRPVIPSKEIADNTIQLIDIRYNLESTYEEMYAYVHDDAQVKVSKGSSEALLKEIFNKYKALESKCQFVLCEGTDFSGVSQPLSLISMPMWPPIWDARFWCWSMADIAISAAATTQMFGIAPRIAMRSYSTGASGKGQEVDKVREAAAIAREKKPELKIEGPIQYDAAVDAGVAKTKLPQSEVAGRATVFIFPDFNTGNNLYKAVQRSANAVAIGPVLQGLNKPVNDLSRGCKVTDIVNTVAITAVQAQALK